MNRVFISGDSTAAAKEESARPETGWGEAFGKYLRPGWVLDNRAINGRSTKDAISSGGFRALLSDAAQGDLVLIQYGHNDEKLCDKARGTSPWHEFITNLVYMAEKLRAKGVSVIFLTPIARRRFVSGKAVDTHGDWPAAMKAAADRAGVPCIDLTIPTMVDLMAAGEEGSRKYYMNFDGGVYPCYPEGCIDDTHLRPEGAEWIARMVYDKLSALPERPEALCELDC